MLPISTAEGSPPDCSVTGMKGKGKGKGKGKKNKCGGARLWMRFGKSGETEMMECDKSAVMKRTSIPARDLRILGPVFSQSSNIIGRQKAVILNLEFIKAIITADEVLLLDPLLPEVIPFVDRLRRHLCHGEQATCPGHGEGECRELPFEFQVMEIALKVVCSFLETSVLLLENDAYPVLDELSKNVGTKNLELVRSLKSSLNRLLARVQKVRDEIEHLLDDNEDMAHLCLTTKMIQSHQRSELLLDATSSNSTRPGPHNPLTRRPSSYKSGSLVTANYAEYDDVEDLEMLLEAYFVQLDGTRNKILSVREYVDDTEDIVSIQLDNQRNELIQLHLTLNVALFVMQLEVLAFGLVSMNIQCNLYSVNGIFGYYVGVTMACGALLFILIIGYARWKKLLGS